jgi:HSP20 family protein
MAQLVPANYVIDVDRVFADMMQGLTGWRLAPQPRGDGDGDSAWVPSIDVFTRNEDLVVRAELPGIDPERDVDISVQNGMLVIRGERKREKRSERDNYYRVETTYGSFLRTVPLPDGVRAEDINASYDQGILEVVVPKGAMRASTEKVPIAITSKGGNGAASNEGTQPGGAGGETKPKGRRSRKS